MIASSTRRKAGLLFAALTGSLFIFAGCNKPGDAPATGGPPSTGANQATTGGGSMAASGGGEELVAASCRCHNGGKAPSLAHIGSDPSHTAGWIAEYANNPKSKDPQSRMPPMQGKVSSEDLTKIATYLASQK